MVKSPIILLTGATAGIGKATARALAPSAEKFILVARNAEKLNALVSELSNLMDADKLDTVVADLSEPSSIEKAVAEIRSRHDQIDLFINNAGGYFSDRRENSVGQEYTFALNHLGYYHLTTRLLDLVKKSPEARIVSVSSMAHSMGEINFDDLMLVENYGAMKAYAQSKLANILFTRELSEQLENHNVTVNCLHPGVVASNFTDNMPGWVQPLMGFARIFMISPEKGAATSIFLATSPEVAEISGEYFVKKKLAKTSPAAKDRALAKKLWLVSEQLVQEGLARS